MIDAHCHLTDKRLLPRVDEIIQRALDAGVKQMICSGTSPADWPVVLELADRFPCIIPTLGLHPWFIAEPPPDWLSVLKATLLERPNTAIGEIGLDHLRNSEQNAEEEKCFRQQIELAKELQRPFIIHCVRAWSSLLKILHEQAPFERGFMIHAYSGSSEIIHELADLGAYFSFAGSATNPNSSRIRKAVKQVPSDRLLIETDSPDFLPWNIQNRKAANEPGKLPHILNAIAELCATPPDKMAIQTIENTTALFPSP